MIKTLTAVSEIINDMWSYIFSCDGLSFTFGQLFIISLLCVFAVFMILKFIRDIGE